MPPPRGSFNPIEGPGDYDVTKEIHNDTYPAISPLAIPPMNKSVFIVGASKGIGISMAKSFAQAGASHIAVAARSNLSTVRNAVLQGATEAKRAAPQVLCIELDITSQKSTEDAAALVEKEFGKLDILVINAGIFTRGTIVESDPEEWWRTWDVNVRGPYLVSRALLPLMLKGGDKTIITTSSVGAHCISPGTSAYQDSKLAVVRLMQFVNNEHADDGVVAFAIHPGNIPVFTETAELSADVLVYLTKEKRDWLGGRYINCTWDMPELMAQKDEIIKGDKLKVRLVF